MDRYEVMAGKMAPLTDGAHRKWGFTGKVETRSYERLVDALVQKANGRERATAVHAKRFPNHRQDAYL